MPPIQASSLGVSRRASELQPSVTVAVANRAKAMRRQGLDVLSFALGEPDFDTPDRIKQAAVEALKSGQTKYMPTLGDPETRQAIADKFTRENRIPGLTADHVAISAGAKHTIYGLCQALFDFPEPGESPQEAVIPVPAWVSYRPIVELSGGRVVEVETTPEADFKMTPDQLRAALTPRTRALFLNSPSNPCGTMYSEGELRALAAVIAEACETVCPQLVILSDEIYEKIVYGGIDPFSIGSVPEVAERTVTINGVSKAFAMTGWRAGYCAIPGDFGKTLINALATLQGQMTTNITSFVYPAIRTALAECADDVERMRSAFASRAKRIKAGLDRIEGLSCPEPTGAFYAFVNIKALFGKTSGGGRAIDSGLSFAEALLEEQLVAVIPGEDFGGCGREHVRISFACSESQIDQGLERIDAFVRALR